MDTYDLMSDKYMYRYICHSDNTHSTWTDTHASQTDTYATQMDTYDLMSDKYITSLLLIKMLKAFIQVNIKSLHLLTYVFLLTLLQICSHALGQLDLPLGQSHMPLKQIHMPPG